MFAVLRETHRKNRNTLHAKQFSEREVDCPTPCRTQSKELPEKAALQKRASRRLHVLAAKKESRSLKQLTSFPTRLSAGRL